MKALRQLGIETPHLAVAALNPHGGEDGLFGREEMDAIKPAIEAARARGMRVAEHVPSVGLRRGTPRARRPGRHGRDPRTTVPSPVCSSDSISPCWWSRSSRSPRA